MKKHTKYNFSFLQATNYKLQARKGFTLIELLLYVGIVAAIVFSIAGFLSLLMQSRVKNQTIAEVEQQGVHVMQLITQTVRNADSINSPAQGEGDDVLSLQVFDSTKSPTVFEIVDNAFTIKEGTAARVSITSSRVIASNPLLFQNLSRTGTPGTIRIQFTLTHVNPSGRNEYNYTKTFYGTATLR